MPCLAYVVEVLAASVPISIQVCDGDPAAVMASPARSEPIDPSLASAGRDVLTLPRRLRQNQVPARITNSLEIALLDEI